jgi:ABC-type multidrug transport system ATPase subunit
MLELKNISKNYGRKIVLKDINIKFDKGIYGLLGPNGAGKSTMMNIITDVIDATSGEVFYNDTSISKLGKDYRLKIAYLPQHVGYYGDFTAGRTLRYFAYLRGVDKKDVDERIKYVLEAVNLSDYENRKVKTFSGGMKQRLGIAITLVSDPEILIFDEPTVGLDPKERIKFRNIISEISEKKTIILSTHIVSDIESIADYVVLLKQGEIVKMDTREGILKLVGNDKEAVSLEDVYMNIYEEASEKE